MFNLELIFLIYNQYQHWQVSVWYYRACGLSACDFSYLQCACILCICMQQEQGMGCQNTLSAFQYHSMSLTAHGTSSYWLGMDLLTLEAARRGSTVSGTWSVHSQPFAMSLMRTCIVAAGTNWSRQKDPSTCLWVHTMGVVFSFKLDCRKGTFSLHSMAHV